MRALRQNRERWKVKGKRGIDGGAAKGKGRKSGGRREGGEREMTYRSEVPLRAVGVLQALTFKVLHSLSLCFLLSLSIIICPLGLLCVHPDTHTHTSPHPSSNLLREALKDSGSAEELVYMRS